MRVFGVPIEHNIPYVLKEFDGHVGRPFFVGRLGVCIGRNEDLTLRQLCGWTQSKVSLVRLQGRSQTRPERFECAGLATLLLDQKNELFHGCRSPMRD